MGKAKRKMRPHNCWFCKNRNNCNGCKLLKRQRAKERKRRQKVNLRKLLEKY